DPLAEKVGARSSSLLRRKSLICYSALVTRGLAVLVVAARGFGTRAASRSAVTITVHPKGRRHVEGRSQKRFDRVWPCCNRRERCRCKRWPHDYHRDTWQQTGQFRYWLRRPGYRTILHRRPVECCDRYHRYAEEDFPRAGSRVRWGEI